MTIIGDSLALMLTVTNIRSELMKLINLIENLCNLLNLNRGRLVLASQM